MLSFGWDPNSIGNVRVVDLVTPEGVDQQDVLTLIPEPSSLLLLGSGFVFAARRLKRRSRR
jgi:hypothetical protein